MGQLWKSRLRTTRGITAGSCIGGSLGIRFLGEPPTTEIRFSGTPDYACRRRPSGRRLLDVALLLLPAPDANRRPFVRSGGLGLVLRHVRNSRFLRCNAALVRLCEHLRNGTVEVRRVTNVLAGLATTVISALDGYLLVDMFSG